MIIKRKLIFLNGTSSSYKSTVAEYIRKDFQHKLLKNSSWDNLYSIYDSDNFFFKIMPTQWQFDQDDSGFICIRDANNKIISVTANENGLAFNSWQNYISTTIAQLVHTMHHIIIAEAICNTYGIINIINAVKNTKIDICEYEVLFVGLESSVEALNNREKLRSDRSTGIAEHQKTFVDDINQKFAHIIINVDDKDSISIGNIIIDEINSQENFVSISEFVKKIEYVDNKFRNKIGFGHKEENN